MCWVRQRREKLVLGFWGVQGRCRQIGFLETGTPSGPLGRGTACEVSGMFARHPGPLAQGRRRGGLGRWAAGGIRA